MMTRRFALAMAAIGALALLATPAAAGKKGKKTAEQIIDELLEIDPFTYGGAEAKVKMVLVNSREQQRERNVVMMSRKDGDTRRTFIRFLAPNNIAGTAFLGLDDDGDRVQHLFLPALGKPRRISTKQRNASFVGTDYTYADLDNRDIEDSRKRRLDDAKVSGKNTYVIDVMPTSKDSDYAKIRMWIAKDSYLPLVMRYFDSKGKEIKRFVVTDAKKREGRWVIQSSKMVDLQKNHATAMQLQAIRFRKDIPLDQFTVQALERQ